MSPPDPVLVAMIVAAGAYVQTVIGFALGLLVVGTATVAGLAPVALMAAVVSFVTLVNASTALYGRTHLVRWRDAGLMIAGMLPAVYAGMALLGYMSRGVSHTLHLVLALFILTGGALLTLKPNARAVPAGDWRTLLMGSVGGLFTGLFATGGPPVVYHMYRQPYEIAAIRATLLATFAAACVARIGTLGWQGGLTTDVLQLSAAGVPASIVGTLLGRRFPLPLGEHEMRRVAFALLLVLGATLLASEWPA